MKKSFAFIRGMMSGHEAMGTLRRGLFFYLLVRPFTNHGAEVHGVRAG